MTFALPRRRRSNGSTLRHSQAIQRQQAQALELARKKFFIPASRMIMGAVYDSRYLRDAQLAASAELAKALETNRDVRRSEWGGVD